MPEKDLKLKIQEAQDILEQLKLPAAQCNERSALSLLALTNITKHKQWVNAEAPLLGITPIMDWIFQNYNKKYAPNSRETIRRQTIHQFLEAGLISYNPDNSSRPVNSPKAVYQITPEALSLIKTYGRRNWRKKLKFFLSVQLALVEKYALNRNLAKIPIIVKKNINIELSPGPHSLLIKNIIEEFAPRYAPGSILVYIGDTGSKWTYYDEKLLNNLEINRDFHGKMPDVVLFEPNKNWLFLIESVTSHGPMDAKRVIELKHLFPMQNLIFVSAFPDRTTLSRFLSAIAWESEVWIADAPDHLIHFNGERFCGPYTS